MHLKRSIKSSKMSSRIIVVLYLVSSKIFSLLTSKKKRSEEGNIYICSTEYVVRWKEKTKTKIREDDVHVVVCANIKKKKRVFFSVDSPN